MKRPLSDSAKLTHSLIQQYWNEHLCFPPVSWIADHRTVNEWTVRKHIRHLRRHGVLSTEAYQPRKKGRYSKRIKPT